MLIVFHGTELNELLYLAVSLYLYSSDLEIDTVSQMIKDDKTAIKKGILYFVGIDQDNNEIYLLGRGKNKNIVVQALLGYNRILAQDDYFSFFDLSPYENFYMRLAIILTKIKMAGLAKIISNKGINQGKKDLIKELSQFKEQLVVKK